MSDLQKDIVPEPADFPIRMKINLIERTSEEDLRSSMEYAKFLDEYYEEIIEKIRPKLKKFQKNIDDSYDAVQNMRVNEGKIRIRIKRNRK